MYDQWVLRVCQALPSLTPWGVWESLEWHLFMALIDHCKRVDAEEKRERRRG